MAVCGRGTMTRMVTAGMSTHAHSELAAHMCACGHTVYCLPGTSDRPLTRQLHYVSTAFQLLFVQMWEASVCRPISHQNAESPNLLPCCAAQLVDSTIFACTLIHAVSCSCFLLCACRVFYNSIPSPVFVPVFIISVMAAIVASQVTNSDTCATPWRQNLSTCHMPPGALCTRTHSFTSCPKAAAARLLLVLSTCCCCPIAAQPAHCHTHCGRR